MSSRWDKIKAKMGKYAGFYARVLRENQSGLTDNDKIILPPFKYISVHMGVSVSFLL